MSKIIIPTSCQPKQVVSRASRFQPDALVAKQYPIFGDEGDRVLYWWAERGLVHCEDSRDNSYSSMDWRDAAIRKLNMSQMILNSDGDIFPDQRQRFQEFLEQFGKVIMLAKKQGGPNDGQAVINAQRRKQRTQVRVKPTIVDGIF